MKRARERVAHVCLPWIARVAVLALVTALGACGSSRQGRTDVPEGFDLPSGVHITKSGANREVGKKATVVYHIEQRAASAVTVWITEIVKGSLTDFEFFNLPDAVSRYTPYYVHVQVRNDGPSGLGGVALPIFARTSNRVFPPNELVGSFTPCPTAALPASFLPGATAPICLVFLVPPDEGLKSIDLQTGSPADAIHFLASVT